MNISTTPAWFDKVIIVGVVLGVLYGATWLYRTLQRKPEPGQVSGSPFCAGGGFLALIGGVAFGLTGIFLSDLSAPGQLAPWLGIVGSFLFAGGWMLFIYTGVLARYDTTGLKIRTWRRRWRTVDWKDVRELKITTSGQLKIMVGTGRSMSLPTDSGGLLGLVEAAKVADVPGAAALTPNR